jgi:hypothetical protein
MKKLEELIPTLNPAQKSSLEQRLEILRTFTAPKSAWSKPTTPRFAPGQITIVDLSDPFIDAASAAGIFEIVLHAFERADVDTGKVVLVDEAHKVGLFFPGITQLLTCQPHSTFPLGRHPVLPMRYSRSFESKGTVQCVYWSAPKVSGIFAALVMSHADMYSGKNQQSFRQRSLRFVQS